MKQIDFRINKKFEAFIAGKPETKKPIQLLDGGRGSGKSRATAQQKVIKSMLGKYRFGLVRKVFDTIRDSQWREIKDVVEEYDLPGFTFITNPLSIRVANGSEFICKGMDKAEKIKSVASLDDVWIEEATELTYDDWLTFMLSIRGETDKYITLTLNRQAGSWIEDEFFKADGTPTDRDDVYRLHTTYHDNRFVGADFYKRMDALKLSNPDLYALHGLGQPVKPAGLIYTNWDIVNELPERGLIEFGGLDFGYFPDPAAFVRCWMSGDEIWLQEGLYENNLTNPRLAERLKELVAQDLEIWADSAEPKSIQDLQDGGFYMLQGVEKGKDSVAHGIQLVQSKKLHILAGSTNLIKEITSYVLKKDAAGNYVSGKPVDYNNHLMDAVRYAIWGKCRENTLNVAFL